MDIEIQKVYDSYFELFSSEGWKQLMEEVNLNASNREKAVLLQDDEKKFHYERGYVGALTYLSNFEAVVQSVYDNLQEVDQENADI